IGADNFASITLVELGADSKPTSLSTIALEDQDGTLGVTSVSMSPEIGMGGNNNLIEDLGTSPGGKAQYVYAVATDNTIRVADILTLGKECDTQADPRLVHDLRNIAKVSCLVVGDPATPRRRAGARGPGIELIADSIPTSVAIVRADPINGDMRPSPTPSKLIGYFAIATAANGATFVINIDDDASADLVSLGSPLSTPVPLVIAHQLRDSLDDRGLLASVTKDMVTTPICDTPGPDPDATTGNIGGPRVFGSPSRVIPSGVVATEKVGSLPTIHHVRCVGSDLTKSVSELAFAAPESTRELAFPDLRALRSDETWSLTWEGSLSQDQSNAAVDGPSIRESQILVDGNGMRIVDASRPFCSAGVEDADVVQLRGCDPNNGNKQCPVGYECYTHPNSQVPGLGQCMLTSEADRLANACEAFLTSIRRYTVKHAADGSLLLAPRKRVLRTTPLSGCTDDAQCKTLADYTAKALSTQNPIDDTSQPDPHKYACMVDADRPPPVLHGLLPGDPVVSTGKRCVMTCTASSDCATGTVCDHNVCMEGVVPPQACVNAPERYEVHVHDAFAVLGTRSGYVHPIIRDAGGNCVRDPSANPFQVGRIPIDAPACDPTTDPRTGQKADGTYDVNPCKTAVVETELAPRYAGETCSAANPSSELVDRTTTSIHFRNAGLAFSIVDPTYPGDLRCHGDRLGSLVDVPHVVPDYQLTFRQTGGLTPLTLPIQPAYPVKVLRGPGQSIWVIDEGDFLSTSIASPSTRGKVYRVEATALNTVNLLE
ncbi:MAG: hypothetical protein NT062_28880, partial [Proteobacteria bacterium]|nr:hypothetical protein [Pseudomonadota bacterium]